SYRYNVAGVALVGSRQPHLCSGAREAVVRLEVALTGSLDDIVGKRRRRGIAVAVPARCRGRQPVADELLVEARLRVAGLPFVRRPEAGGIRREHLVADEDLALGGAAELELRVREDDAARGGELVRAVVDAEGQVAKLGGL